MSCGNTSTYIGPMMSLQDDYGPPVTRQPHSRNAIWPPHKSSTQHPLDVKLHLYVGNPYGARRSRGMAASDMYFYKIPGVRSTCVRLDRLLTVRRKGVAIRGWIVPSFPSGRFQFYISPGTDSSYDRDPLAKRSARKCHSLVLQPFLDKLYGISNLEGPFVHGIWAEAGPKAERCFIRLSNTSIREVQHEGNLSW